MLPAALVVAGWLWCTASRKLALLWLGVLSAAYFVVGLSKVLFKGWGIGLESLDIAVISGHAMNACLVSTVVLSLLLRQLDHRLRWLALGAGLLSTWWFSVQYVAQSIHPLSEAVAGAVVGSAAACVFLYRLEKKQVRKIPPQALVLGLAIIMLSTSIPKYTAEGALNSIAVALSGAEKAVIQPHWRTSAKASRL
nr:phosphatase PAP2 family protein [Pseudomonas izuensis]